jgi:hypothetical protein
MTTIIESLDIQTTTIQMASIAENAENAEGEDKTPSIETKPLNKTPVLAETLTLMLPTTETNKIQPQLEQKTDNCLIYVMMMKIQKMIESLTEVKDCMVLFSKSSLLDKDNHPYPGMLELFYCCGTKELPIYICDENVNETFVTQQQLLSAGYNTQYVHGFLQNEYVLYIQTNILLRVGHFFNHQVQSSHYQQNPMSQEVKQQQRQQQQEARRQLVYLDLPEMSNFKCTWQNQVILKDLFTLNTCPEFLGSVRYGRTWNDVVPYVDQFLENQKSTETTKVQTAVFDIDETLIDKKMDSIEHIQTLFHQCRSNHQFQMVLLTARCDVFKDVTTCTLANAGYSPEMYHKCICRPIDLDLSSNETYYLVGAFKRNQREALENVRLCVGDQWTDHFEFPDAETCYQYVRRSDPLGIYVFVLNHVLHIKLPHPVYTTTLH